MGAYVPGQRSRPLPTGHARLVPAGSKFIFQMHYTPNGSEQPDHTNIGLVFADEDDVEQEVLTLYAVEGNFEIPPFAKNHRVDAWIDEWPADARLLSMVPHMHVRGRSFRFVAHYADGRQEELLHVPRYDFNWQNNYRLATPLPIPPGFAVHCSGRYDNSASNLLNPDPSQSVRWGDQSWEEMMIAFFEVAVPRGSRAPVIAAQPTSAERQTAAETAARIFRRFDLDEDQLLVRSELPGVFAAFAFQRYDIDADRRISFDEVRTALLRGRSEN